MAKDWIQITERIFDCGEHPFSMIVIIKEKNIEIPFQRKKLAKFLMRGLK